MLKDLRLGLAVGGVLIAVVVAYVVFFTGGTPKTGGKPGDSGLQSNSSAGGSDNHSRSVASNTDLRGNSSNSSQTDASAGNNSAANNTTANTSSTNTNAPNGSANIAVSDGSTAPTADWNAALDHGTISSLVARTETPTGANNGANNAGNTSSAGPAGSRDVTIPPGGVSANAGNTSSNTNATTPPAATGKRTCQIKQGESLWTIAQREYGNGAYFTHILHANPGLDANRLRLGMTINLPDKTEVIPAASAARDAAAANVTSQPFDATKHYKVQQGDSLYVISKKLYGKIDRVNKLYDLNKDQIGPNPAALKKGMVLILPEAPTVAQNGGNTGNGVAGSPVQ